MELRRIGALSLAKVSAVVYALLGLVLGAIFSLISVAGSILTSPKSGIAPFPPLGAAAVIILPALYGAIGFVGSLIGAAIYNVVAGLIGGVHIELREVAPPGGGLAE